MYANIPLNKIMNTEFRSFLEKYILEDIPCESTKEQSIKLENLSLGIQFRYLLMKVLTSKVDLLRS